MKAKTSTFSAAYILRKDKAKGVEAPLFLAGICFQQLCRYRQ